MPIRMIGEGAVLSDMVEPSPGHFHVKASRATVHDAVLVNEFRRSKEDGVPAVGQLLRARLLVESPGKHESETGILVGVRRQMQLGRIECVGKSQFAQVFGSRDVKGSSFKSRTNFSK